MHRKVEVLTILVPYFFQGKICLFISLNPYLIENECILKLKNSVIKFKIFNPVLKSLGYLFVSPQIKCITALYFASFSKQQKKSPRRILILIYGKH